MGKTIFNFFNLETEIKVFPSISCILILNDSIIGTHTTEGAIDSPNSCKGHSSQIRNNHCRTDSCVNAGLIV